MSEEKPDLRAHPDLYEGLSKLDRRTVELLASTRFADAKTKKRIYSAARKAHDCPRRNFPKTLVLAPASLALLAALVCVTRPSHRLFERKQGNPKIYVDLASRYYSAEEIHAALRGS